MDSSCFRREDLDFENTLFENVVDACYLITMEKSTRRKQYMSQLHHYKPFNKIQIIHNAGFRNCQKDPKITTPMQDIADVYAQIFKECIQQNKQRVLIFEDDFFFVDSCEELKTYILDIQMFLDKSPDFMTYNLGALPYFMFPSSINLEHYIYKGGASHSIIYSAKAMINYVRDYESMTCSSDTYWNAYLENYAYHKPFCFQLCPKTENSDHWCKYVDINALLRSYFKADETHEHLFPFAYCASKTFSLFALFVLINKFKKSNI